MISNICKIAKGTNDLCEILKESESVALYNGFNKKQTLQLRLICEEINGKKISGILAESVIEKNILKGIILGCGVNLNCSKEDMENIDQPATSLNLETGMEVDREIFLKRVLDKFCLRYNKFIEDGFKLIREDYIKRAEFLNKTVTVKVFDKDISGLAKDITENGALEIVDNNNEKHVLLIGDIL